MGRRDAEAEAEEDLESRVNEALTQMLNKCNVLDEWIVGIRAKEPLFLFLHQILFSLLLGLMIT